MEGNFALGGKEVFFFRVSPPPNLFGFFCLPLSTSSPSAASLAWGLTCIDKELWTATKSTLGVGSRRVQAARLGLPKYAHMRPCRA